MGTYPPPEVRIEKNNLIKINTEYLEDQLKIVTRWVNKTTDEYMLKSLPTETLQKLHNMCEKEIHAREK